MRRKRAFLHVLDEQRDEKHQGIPQQDYQTRLPISQQRSPVEASIKVHSYIALLIGWPRT